MGGANQGTEAPALTGGNHTQLFSDASIEAAIAHIPSTAMSA